MPAVTAACHQHIRANTSYTVVLNFLPKRDPVILANAFLNRAPGLVRKVQQPQESAKGVAMKILSVFLATAFSFFITACRI